MQREESPPSAGPPITDSWKAIERCANALTRIVLRDERGRQRATRGRTERRGEPVPNASAKNGHV